jgi:hypothetical protein
LVVAFGEWDLNLTLLIMMSDERSSLGSADEND